MQKVYASACRFQEVTRGQKSILRYLLFEWNRILHTALAQNYIKQFKMHTCSLGSRAIESRVIAIASCDIIDNLLLLLLICNHPRIIQAEFPLALPFEALWTAWRFGVPCQAKDRAYSSTLSLRLHFGKTIRDSNSTYVWEPWTSRKQGSNNRYIVDSNNRDKHQAVNTDPNRKPNTAGSHHPTPPWSRPFAVRDMKSANWCLVFVWRPVEVWLLGMEVAWRWTFIGVQERTPWLVNNAFYRHACCRWHKCLLLHIYMLSQLCCKL